MNAPFKGPIQNEPTRNMHTTLQQEMESCSHGNLCSALPTATKTTTNITKTTDDDRCGKEKQKMYLVQLIQPEPVFSNRTCYTFKLAVSGP
jgi:hypothetical protein